MTRDGLSLLHMFSAGNQAGIARTASLTSGSSAETAGQLGAGGAALLPRLSQAR